MNSCLGLLPCLDQSARYLWSLFLSACYTASCACCSYSENPSWSPLPPTNFLLPFLQVGGLAFLLPVLLLSNLYPALGGIMPAENRCPPPLS